MASVFRLLSEAGLVRRNLIVFALATAALNGLVTASVGAWLAQSYSVYQARRAAMQSISDLIYERRTRGGMVVSTLRRGADLDELRHRKRAYDEVFVEWNKRLQSNMMQIREVVGTTESAVIERLFQELLAPPLTTMDVCLTKGYDVRLQGQDPLPIIQDCHYATLHQFTLDCGAAMTDELYRLSALRFMPFSGPSRAELAAVEQRIRVECRPPVLPPKPVSVPLTASDVPAPANAPPSAPVPAAKAP